MVRCIAVPAFKDYKIDDIYWIVPISSRFEKFKRIEQDKINKYGHCNTIRFGTVLGRNTACSGYGETWRKGNFP